MPGSVSVWVKSGGNKLSRVEKSSTSYLLLKKKFMMVFIYILYVIVPG